MSHEGSLGEAPNIIIENQPSVRVVSPSAMRFPPPNLSTDDDLGAVSEVDVFEASDIGDDDEGHVSPALAVESSDFGNTFQEILKLDDSNYSILSKDVKSVSSLESGQLLSVSHGGMEEGHTDIEELEDNDDFIEIEEVEYTEEDLRIIDTILGEEGVVDISDHIRQSMSGTPSPAITPEPSSLSKQQRKSFRSPKKFLKKRFLSPTPSTTSVTEKSAESDLTSRSQNEKERSGHRMRRRRTKSPRIFHPGAGIEGHTDVEDLELSATDEHDDENQSTDILYDISAQSRITISHDEVAKVSETTEMDTEAEEMAASDFDDNAAFGSLLSLPTVKNLNVSPEPLEAVTDQEEIHFDFNEATALKKMEEYYSSVAVLHGTKGHRHRPETQPSSGTSSDEEISSTRKFYGKRKVPKIILCKAEEVESSEPDESVEMDWTSDTPGHIQEYATDREDVRLDGSDCDSRIDSKSQILGVPLLDTGALTDTEMYEDEDALRPCTPEPDDDDSDERIPAPIRELTLLKEIEEGRPESVVLPLGDAQPQGLLVPAEETGGLTDTEDLPYESDEDEVSECKSPDIPDLEGGTVESTDSVKIQKKRSKFLSPESENVDSVTDTEDLYLSVGGSRKRRGRTRLGEKPKSETLSIVSPVQGTSDIEEIEVSDFETPPLGITVIKRDCQFLTVSPNQGEKTDIEDMSAPSGPDEDEGESTDGRGTPECLKSFGVDVVTSIEGDGPFSAEQRQEMALAKSILKSQSSYGIVSTPEGGIQTDVEDDLMTSADEEIVRSARASIDAEQSVVFDANTRKVNLETPEEILYVKGTPLTENYTDVEDVGLSEEEMTGRIAVIDTTPKVCVCLTSTEAGPLSNAVCVCVSRRDDELSLLMTSSTSATGQGADNLTEIKSAELEAEAPEEEAETQ